MKTVRELFVRLQKAYPELDQSCFSIQFIDNELLIVLNFSDLTNIIEIVCDDSDFEKDIDALFTDVIQSINDLKNSLLLSEDSKE